LRPKKLVPGEEAVISTGRKPPVREGKNGSLRRGKGEQRVQSEKGSENRPETRSDREGNGGNTLLVGKEELHETIRLFTGIVSEEKKKRLR